MPKSKLRNVRYRLPQNPAEPQLRLARDPPPNTVVRPAIVDNPLATELGEKQVSWRNIRNDPLASLDAHNFIENHQYLAGRQYQKYIENSEIGGARAIDPTREAVDGGGKTLGLTDKQMSASDALLEADEILGDEGKALVYNILAQGMTIRQAAAIRGFTSKKALAYYGNRLRECLQKLAELWGFCTDDHNI